MDEITFLENLISIPSPSGHEDAVADFLVAHMAGSGFQAHRDEAGNVIGTLGDPQAGRTIVLLGHMDTVSGVVPLRQEEGRLYGRGAVDAKGPLAAFVLASARVAPRLNGARLLVIGAVEEESHSRGARHLARTMPAPYCTIIGEPSDWQGVTLGYKGVLSFDYQVLQARRHSAGAKPGPAEKAVALWNQLGIYATEYNRGRSGSFDTLDPALTRLCTFSDGLNDGAEMSISMRLPLGIEGADLQQELRSWCNGARLIFHPSDPPFQAAKNTPLVRAMLRSIRAQGGRPRFKLKTGTSDMNVVGPAWNCPIVAYGPGDSSLDHTPDEHIEVEEFRRSVDVLAGALEILAASP